jgi:hypothetical protein
MSKLFFLFLPQEAAKIPASDSNGNLQPQPKG